MNDRTRSAAGRVLSELYRRDEERREEPVEAPERSGRDGDEADDDRRGERAA